MVVGVVVRVVGVGVQGSRFGASDFAFVGEHHCWEYLLGPSLPYRLISLIRKRTPLGPYRRPMPRVIGGHRGVVIFSWARYPCIGGEALRARIWDLRFSSWFCSLRFFWIWDQGAGV
jgi:hypothetical protein